MENLDIIVTQAIPEKNLKFPKLEEVGSSFIKKSLCLGCVGGYQRHEHVFAADVNVDWRFEAGYRNLIVHDLNVFPYPFEDDEFEKVFASHVLEHLDNPQKALYEMLRIARIVEIYVPHRYSRYAKQKDHKAVFSCMWFKKALAGLPVIFTEEVAWNFPLGIRPRDIHIVIVKKDLPLFRRPQKSNLENIVCPKCDGKGYIGGWLSGVDCPWCHGKGRIKHQ